MKKPFILLGGAAVLGAALIAGFGTASGADHGDAPLAKANHQLDLADVYAFDGGAGNVALAFTVNPTTGSEPSVPNPVSALNAVRLNSKRVDANAMPTQSRMNNLERSTTCDGRSENERSAAKLAIVSLIEVSAVSARPRTFEEISESAMSQFCPPRSRRVKSSEVFRFRR